MPAHGSQHACALFRSVLYTQSPVGHSCPSNGLDTSLLKPTPCPLICHNGGRIFCRSAGITLAYICRNIAYDPKPIHPGLVVVLCAALPSGIMRARVCWHIRFFLSPARVVPVLLACVPLRVAQVACYDIFTCFPTPLVPLPLWLLLVVPCCLAYHAQWPMGLLQGVTPCVNVTWRQTQQVSCCKRL